MRFNVVIALFCLIPLPLQADQPTKPDRKAPLKEPAYRGTPHYALLTFGPAGKDRVWLVVDGDVVHIDRNANGDLTEEGEMVALSSGVAATDVPQYRVRRTANLGEIRIGRQKHTGVQLTQSWVNGDFKPATPDEKALMRSVKGDTDAWVVWLSLSVQVQLQSGDGPRIIGRILQVAGKDRNGYLHFSPSTRTAPVIHLGGPVTLDLLCAQELQKGEKPSELMVMIGTPGVGAGTFASIGYHGVVSDAAQPVAEIQFPALPEGEGIVGKIPLPHRC